MSKTAGYLHGNYAHHLDHLAPLCGLLGFPLVVSDEEIYEMSRKYYPELILHLWDPVTAPFELTKQFDTIVTTLARWDFDGLFFIAEASLGKRLKTIWLPHGNSDKGHLWPWKELFAKDEAAFIYGPKMADLFVQKNVQIPQLVPVGNFRYAYFQKHRQFYDQLLDEMGLSKSFILYAPTWRDGEDSSSFEVAIDAIMEQLSHLPLVIKPHPNERDNIRVIQSQLTSKATWLNNFPPVYPILERVSHLIGDFSSVGYDFLCFNRPMFFIKSPRSHDDPGCFLRSYGTVLDIDNIHEDMLRNPYHPKEQIEALATYTFGEKSTWGNVKLLDI